MDSGFFKWVWRFNGLAIALAVPTVLFTVAWNLFSEMRRGFASNAHNVIAAPADTETETPAPVPLEEDVIYSTPLRGNRAGLYALRVEKRQKLETRFGSKSSSSNLINYMIVDSNQGTASALFETGTRLITRTEGLYFTDQDGPNQKLGFVLTVIEQDTNRDGRLSRSDEQSLYFMGLDFSQLVELVAGVSEELHIRAFSGTSFDLIYTKDDRTVVQRFSAPDVQAGNITELPPLR